VTSADEARKVLADSKFPVVLKADGLALGKGVLICETPDDAEVGVRMIMEDKKFGSAGDQMVIEEFMTGREVSVLSFVDGKTYKLMSSAQDHKRAGDGDTGLNTGGMGNFSPSPFYTEEVDDFCKKYIYQKTVDAMAAEGREFKGVIFFGLMLGRLISGFVSNRLGDRKLIRLGIGTELFGILLVFIPVEGWLIAAVGFIIIGTGMGPVYPAIQHMAPGNFGRRFSAAVISLQMAFAYIGSTFMPTVFGWLQQAIGISIMPLWLLVFACANLLLLEVGYRKLQVHKV